jgi:hypothetical protein
MAEVRYFTAEEAQRALPLLKPLLAQLREAFHAYRFARAQVDELLSTYEEDPSLVTGHPMEQEARRWKAEAARADARVREALARIADLGADVKDPIVGLVDFYARRPRTGEIVLLCYRDDEDRLGWWHPLETGFAGRRPLDEL